jgi:indolepyruvate ferredoxin oxidoreductase alpha subunit
VGAGDKTTGTPRFLLGNEVIALAAIEAGVQYAAGYPGTPSSEIIQALVKHAKAQDMYVEWSNNEKVAN